MRAFLRPGPLQAAALAFLIFVIPLSTVLCPMSTVRCSHPLACAGVQLCVRDALAFYCGFKFALPSGVGTYRYAARLSL